MMCFFFQSLINQRTFNMLPPWYQYQLVMMLPSVDKSIGPDGALRCVFYEIITRNYVGRMMYHAIQCNNLTVVQ